MCKSSATNITQGTVSALLLLLLLLLLTRMFAVEPALRCCCCCHRPLRITREGGQQTIAQPCTQAATTNSRTKQIMIKAANPTSFGTAGCNRGRRQ
jgi:hypothetical protein